MHSECATRRVGCAQNWRQNWERTLLADAVVYHFWGGCLTSLNRPNSSGWFFHFKKMPVKYFVILDTSLGREVSFLAREVAWAALRAQGLGKGEYEPRKYAEASDILFQKCAEQRLACRMPKELGGWCATKMAES